MKTNFIGLFGLFAILAAVAVITWIFGAVGLIFVGSAIAAGLNSGRQPDSLEASKPRSQTGTTTARR